MQTSTDQEYVMTRRCANYDGIEKPYMHIYAAIGMWLRVMLDNAAYVIAKMVAIDILTDDGRGHSTDRLAKMVERKE